MDQHARTHRIVLEPQDESAKRAMRGNLWKSTRPSDRSKIIDLGRSIAAKLLEEDGPGFVFFHVDGDRVWSERTTSENVEKFDAFVRDFVRQTLDNVLRRKRRKAGEPLNEEALQHEIETALSRLFRLTPFYSIEAWLYQNTVEARRLCGLHCGKHISAISEWEKDRSLLDEVLKPKSKEFSCLEDRHNIVLAENGFPAESAFGAGKSYAHAVMAMLDSKELLGALASTYA
ncbi:MAG: hypothetical protein L6Q76_16615 [Polyangiaceae bacterium]|nr:hypothetical protein [Polyangiaceae bacterium]